MAIYTCVMHCSILVELSSVRRNCLDGPNREIEMGAVNSLDSIF